MATRANVAPGSPLGGASLSGAALSGATLWAGASDAVGALLTGEAPLTGGALAPGG
jgi:hypothetical protein